MLINHYLIRFITFTLNCVLKVSAALGFHYLQIDKHIKLPDVERSKGLATTHKNKK